MQNSDFRTRITSLYGSQTSSVVLSTHNNVLSTRVSRLYGFQPSPVVLCMQNSDFRARITSLCWSQTWPVLCACTTVCLASDLLVSMGPRPHLWYLIAKQRLLVQHYKTVWVPDLTYRFVHAKQHSGVEDAILHAKTTGGVLDQQRLVILVKKTLFCMHKTTGEGWSKYSLGYQTSLAGLCMQTAWLAPELLVSMDSRPYLWFCAWKIATLGPDIQVCVGPRPHLFFWAHITACLAQECKGYTGSSPHCGFCMQNSDFWTRITSFYVSQKWPVILWMYNSVITTRITSLYGSQPSSLAFLCKIAPFRPK